jgi:DNA-binding NarL/FixJ family response regulator
MIEKQVIIKILLVDDHRIVLDGLKSLFEKDAEFEITAAAGSPQEALDILKIQQPDILVTDYTLPGMTGLELSTKVKELYPQIKRVILSMHDEGHLVKQIMKAGVDGYLLKSIQQGELKTAFRQIMNGMPYISPEITKQLMTGLANESKQELLTDREHEIVKLIVKEFSNKQIAEKLFISERTVETHRKNIFRKTNTTSLVGLVKFALEHNII